MKGIDFSLWRPPSPQWVRDQGYGFVCRYLSFGAQQKVIGETELQGYLAAGLDVVLVWEYGAQDMLGGWTAGTGDAQGALAQAQRLGVWPCPIYFAADWDVQPSEYPLVDAYLKAAALKLGNTERVGIYGGFPIVSHVLDGGFARYAWQTYAWSNGEWDLRAQLRQVPGGTPDYDLDESAYGDFGQVPLTQSDYRRRVAAAVSDA